MYDIIIFAVSHYRISGMFVLTLIFLQRTSFKFQAVNKMLIIIYLMFAIYFFYFSAAPLSFVS